MSNESGGEAGINGVPGTSYQSEDDFDDYTSKPVPGPFFNSNENGGGNGSSGGGNGSSGNNGATTTTAPASSSPGRSQTCCLVDDGRRCHRSSGNASYSKRIQKTVYYKRLRLENDPQAQHIYICDYHKMVIQNARTRQKRDSEDELNETEDLPDVDLYQLQVNTLRRYKKHFKIPTRPGLNKAQLSDILMRHFRTIPVMEKETITYFIYMVKSERNKLDSNTRTESNNEF